MIYSYIIVYQLLLFNIIGYLRTTKYFRKIVKKKVVIGLSGGVDSSVAAYLLKEQGYDVTAIFMINHKDKTGTLTSSCSWEDDVVFAEMCAKKLDIPFHVVDLSEHYQKRVIEYMFDEYEKGRTPNPDVLCNREMKFDIFLKKAEEFGAEYVATGHYCRVDSENGTFKLLAGVDNNKDQSYFLCQLNQEQLSKSLFPIGGLEKPEVRRIAKEQGLVTAERKDSQGICFVGKVDLPLFLQQKLDAKKGNVIEIPDSFSKKKSINDVTEENLSRAASAFPLKPWNGKVVGEHNGAHFYTIGQRKGLNIGGYKEPLFVLSTDIKRNIIYVGEGREHAGLYRKALFITEEEQHWIREDLKLAVGEEREFQFRIRYRQPLEKGKLLSREDGLYIVFDNPQRGVTSGQFASWYIDDELIGSGVIS